MILSIHQPNYLPWLGYFYKIFASDVFVFHDVVGFSKASYTKRCKIRKAKTSAETTWLSVPVQRHSSNTPISHMRIGKDNGWIHKHLRRIENTYSTAPFYEENFAWLRQNLIQCASEQVLAENNIQLIRALAERLALKARFCKSSEMPLSGNGTDLNLAIATHLGAKKYLAGIGSRNYQDDTAFSERGIQIVTHDFGGWSKEQPYDQGTDTFTGGLSIVDALMHIGVDGILNLFGKFQRSGFDSAN